MITDKTRANVGSMVAIAGQVQRSGGGPNAHRHTAGAGLQHHGSAVEKMNQHRQLAS